MNDFENNIQGDIDKIIEEIIKVRKKKGMSQLQVAKGCDVPAPTISRLESFTVEPKVSTLIKICNVLGLKITCQFKK